MPSTRRLRLLVRTARGALPAVVAAAVLPIEACDAADARQRDVQTPNAGSAGSATGFAGMVGGFPSAAGDAGLIIIPSGDQCHVTIELPPEGVPAEPGQICAARMTPVDSNRAAHVELNAPEGSVAQVTGTIEIAASLRGSLLSDPRLDVIDATAKELFSLIVTSMTASDSGFSFDGHFVQPLDIRNDGLTRMTVRVTLEAACDFGPQVVHSVTDIHFCSLERGGGVWVSSGSVCSVCQIIAEMAPSPIVPDARADGLPLARVLRLRVVELARVGASVVLFAEHDGGADCAYEWSASVGRIEPLAPDVIQWTGEDGVRAPFVQVAAIAAEGAAVASWAFNERAS